MKPNFSGYATKNNIKCTDGRTIMADAFKHNDKLKVPLVWQHQHDNHENILGHALLENRADGVYAYGFFNETKSGENAKALVEHGDVQALSIYANNLTQQGKNVLHGNIREVSLVLSGANSGAFIENVNIQHGDQIDTLDDEAIISAGLELEHADNTQGDTVAGPAATATKTEDEKGGGKTVADVYESMTEEQQNVVNFMIGEALEASDDDDDSLEQNDNTEALIHSISEGVIKAMPRNVFDQSGTSGSGGDARPTLSHAQLKTIVDDASRLGSLKESFLEHAGSFGIDNIEVLFPDAKSLRNAPDVIGRRTEWVADVLAKTKHSPFSRIKSTAVDLTAEEARAKGYVKGNLKKDEIVRLLKRVTTPTTIYKKQKLDRDDIVDITEIDVVAWLKAEMRVMLDEELARAVLVGDGREADDEDKINEDHIRPIAYDADMYAHQVNMASGATPAQTIEAVVRARRYYKGTGTPSFYTTDETLTDLILDKDTLGRRYYNTEAELAAALRVDKIVTVEVMEDAGDIVGILVNLSDYTIGADKGGAVAMFDDFDIDYNQQKYLIETRVSGALTKPKSAIVVRRTAANIVTPVQPNYNAETNVLTIPNVTGVVYSIDGIDMDPGALTIVETTDVEARPAANYSFTPESTDSWVYVV